MSETVVPIGCKQCGLFLFNYLASKALICSRCNETLYQPIKQYRLKLFSISLTGLILLFTSLFFPFLTLSLKGITHPIFITDIIKGLWHAGYQSIALLFLVTVIILPLFFLFACAVLSFPLKKDSDNDPYLIRFIEKSADWLLIDVLIVGIMVSYTKMGAFGDLYFHFGFIALFLTSICLIYIQYLKNAQALWFLIPLKIKPPHQLHYTCNACHLLSEHELCDHCHQVIMPINKKNMLNQCWAYLITAIILYIPANVLPMMITSQLSKESGDTILSGIILLWDMHSYSIAIIIFFASIFIPLFKIFILAWLFLNLNKGSSKQHCFWFRVTHLIGKWSFIDIFVIAILVALIQFGELIHITPGPASIAFTGVVIFTLLSAHSFSTHLFFNNNTSENHSHALGTH